MAKKKTKKIIKKTSKRKVVARPKKKAKRAKKISLPKGQRIVVKEIIDEVPIAQTQEIPGFVHTEANICEFDVEITSFAPFEVSEPVSQAVEAVPLIEEELIIESENSGLTTKQKGIIMWTSIVTIMSVVVIFWVFAVRNSLSQSLQTLQIENTNSVNQISKSWDDVMASFSNVKNSISQQGQAIGSFAGQLKTQIIAGVIKDAAADKIKKKLENLNVEANNLNQELNTNSIK